MAENGEKLEICSEDAVAAYLEMRQAWFEAGKKQQAFAKIIGLTICPTCGTIIPKGKRHIPFNGNQMFACTEIDDTPFDVDAAISRLEKSPNQVRMITE